jgi:hypothetical protein
VSAKSAGQQQGSEGSFEHEHFILKNRSVQSIDIHAGRFNSPARLLAASSYGTYNGSAIWLVMALVNPLSLADCAIELKRHRWRRAAWQREGPRLIALK